MPAFTHGRWHQTRGHSIFAVIRAQFNEESVLGEEGGEGVGVADITAKKNVRGNDERKGSVLSKAWRAGDVLLGGCHMGLW